MTLLRISEIIHEWLGWCPNAGTLRTAPAAVSPDLRNSAPDIPQSGGTSGSGRRGRGFLLFMGSIRILRENMSLAWYTLLAAAWTLFAFAQIASLRQPPFTSGIAGSSMFLPAPGTIPWLLMIIILTLILEYGGVLLTIGIMNSAGKTQQGRSVDLAESLAFAVKHTRSAYGYILLLTAFGLFPFVITAFFPGSFIAVVLAGVVETAGVVFMVATLFVVPILAFEEVGLTSAMRRSASWLKRVWAETAVGAILYGLVFLLSFFVVLIMATIGIVAGNPSSAMPGLPETNLILGTILVVEMAVIIPLGSIFLYGLYEYAKDGALPPSFDAPQKTGADTRQSGRFTRGFFLVKKSVGLIRQNTAILVFSILTGMMVWLNMIAVYTTNMLAGSSTGLSAVSAMIAKGSFSGLFLIFAADFAGCMLVTFLVAGLFTVVSFTLAGRIPTVRQGLEHARLHLRPIITWALLITTVQTVESAALAVFPGTVQEIGGVILLLSVYTMTLFVVPVFLFEDKGLYRAIVSSAGIVRKYWKETAGGLATVVTVFGILAIIGLIPVFIINGGSYEPGLPGEIMLDTMFAAVMIVSEILIVCLYLYATGRMPGPDEKRPYPGRLQHDPHV